MKSEYIIDTGENIFEVLGTIDRLLRDHGFYLTITFERFDDDGNPVGMATQTMPEVLSDESHWEDTEIWDVKLIGIEE